MLYRVYDIRITESNLECDYSHDDIMYVFVPEEEDIPIVRYQYMREYILENLEVETDTPDWIEVEIYDVEFYYEEA